MLASIIVLVVILALVAIFFVPSWLSNHNRYGSDGNTGFYILAGFVVLFQIAITAAVIVVAYHFIHKYW